MYSKKRLAEMTIDELLVHLANNIAYWTQTGSRTRDKAIGAIEREIKRRVNRAE